MVQLAVEAQRCPSSVCEKPEMLMLMVHGGYWAAVGDGVGRLQALRDPSDGFLNVFKPCGILEGLWIDFYVDSRIDRLWTDFELVSNGFRP